MKFTKREFKPVGFSGTMYELRLQDEDKSRQTKTIFDYVFTYLIDTDKPEVTPGKFYKIAEKGLLKKHKEWRDLV